MLFVKDRRWMGVKTPQILLCPEIRRRTPCKHPGRLGRPGGIDYAGMWFSMAGSPGRSFSQPPPHPNSRMRSLPCGLWNFLHTDSAGGMTGPRAMVKTTGIGVIMEMGEGSAVMDGDPEVMLYADRLTRALCSWVKCQGTERHSLYRQ